MIDPKYENVPLELMVMMVVTSIVLLVRYPWMVGARDLSSGRCGHVRRAL